MKLITRVLPLAFVAGFLAHGGPNTEAQALRYTSIVSSDTAAMSSTAPSWMRLPPGFYANIIARVPYPRELTSLPNGDLLVGGEGQDITIIPGADATGVAGAPGKFITLPEGQATSVSYAPNGAIYAATTTTIWKIKYRTGDRFESNATAIARVRTGPLAPHSDGDNHKTTSVVASATALYVGVGSSCDACVEVDPTRAAVLKMDLNGLHSTTLATRTRNPIALALSWTGALFIGGAGQDKLKYGHPLEYFDSPMMHGPGVADYGWPNCEEKHVAYNPLHTVPTPTCANTIAPAIEFPAYSTIVGAAFYRRLRVPNAFPSGYNSGVFVTSKGSWHCCPSTPPIVSFVPMPNGMAPTVPVNWSNPFAQSKPFIWGWGTTSSTNYSGRPTGLAVGKNGSLFVADSRGLIYRIRYSSI